MEPVSQTPDRGHRAWLCFISIPASGPGRVVQFTSRHTLGLNMIVSETRCLIAFAIALAGIASDASAFGTTQVIAVSGETAPDGNGVYDSFIAPLVNDVGQVVFAANLTHTAMGNDDNGVVLRGTPSGLTTVLRESQPAPDNNGVFKFADAGGGPVFSPQSAGADSEVSNLPNSFFDLSINDSGQVAFTGRLVDPEAGWTGNGVFIGTGDSLQQIVRNGQITVAGDTFDGIQSSMRLNDLGQTLILTEQDNTYALYRGSVGSLSLIAEDGQAITGTGQVAHVRSTTLFKSTLNQRGQVAFTHQAASYLASDPAVPAQSVSGGIHVDMLSIEYLPLTSSVKLNHLGDLAFIDLELFDEPFFRNMGIFIRTDGQVVPVVETFDTITLPDGDTFFVSHPSLLGFNDSKQVLFKVVEGGGVDLYRADGEEIIRLIGPEDAAPDDGNGVGPMRALAFNQKGQALVKIEYFGESDQPSELVLCDDVLGCQQVLRIGDALLGSTIEDMEYSYRSEPANNSGQVAINVHLADGREAIVLWTPTIPGDANMDYEVGLLDLDLMGVNFGHALQGWQNADFNGDGHVGLLDLDALGLNFGRSALPGGEPVGVPEPTVAALLALGALGAARRRR